MQTIPMSKTKIQRVVENLVGVLVLVTFGLGKPGQECLGRLADLLTGRQVDVLLAGLGAPFGDDIFRKNVLIVQNQKDLGSLIVEGGVLLATETNETFNTAEESLLVFLGSDQLHLC